MSMNFPIPKHNLIGHRGAAGLRPENTLCSFKAAAELGLNCIEFDVQLSKDFQWVVMHDEKIDRTTNGSGLVKEHTLEELSKLEAGLWFKPPYPNEHIPTLFATLDLARNLNLFCNIEVKSTNSDPHEHARIFKEFIFTHPALVADRISVSSFDTKFLQVLRKIAPQMPIGYLCDQFAEDTISIVKDYNFNSISCDVTKIAVHEVNSANKQNIPVFLFTVNDPSTAKFWLEHGVSALFTDRPDLLL